MTLKLKHYDALSNIRDPIIFTRHLHAQEANKDFGAIHKKRLTLLDIFSLDVAYSNYLLYELILCLKLTFFTKDVYHNGFFEELFTKDVW